VRALVQEVKEVAICYRHLSYPSFEDAGAEERMSVDVLLIGKNPASESRFRHGSKEAASIDLDVLRVLPPCIPIPLTLLAILIFPRRASVILGR